MMRFGPEGIGTREASLASGDPLGHRPLAAPTPKGFCTRFHIVYTMPRTVSVRLDDDTTREVDRLAKEFRTDRSEILRRVLEVGLREARFQSAVEQLRAQKVSLERAAELAGISLFEMLDAAERADVAYGYSSDDLSRDLLRLRPRAARGARGKVPS